MPDNVEIGSSVIDPAPPAGRPGFDPTSPANMTELAPSGSGILTVAIRRLLRNHRLLSGVILLLLLSCLAIFASVWAPYDPSTPGLAMPRSGPTSDHWLGVDALGRDVLSRLIYGARASLIVGLTVVALNVVIGTLVGLCSGYFGSWLDTILMRFTDLVLAFPLFLVAVAIVGSLSASLTNVVLVLGLLGWPSIARLVRSSVLSVRRREYIESARTIGANDARIILRHVFPNVLGPIIVAATFGVASAILLEASLSFLGLGVQPPTPSWGNMLSEAQSLSTLQSRPYLWAPPGIAIVFLVAAMNLIGNGLDDEFQTNN